MAARRGAASGAASVRQAFPGAGIAVKPDSCGRGRHWGVGGNRTSIFPEPPKILHPRPQKFFKLQNPTPRRAPRYPSFSNYAYRPLCFLTEPPFQGQLPTPSTLSLRNSALYGVSKTPQFRGNLELGVGCAIQVCALLQQHHFAQQPSALHQALG